MSSNDLLYNVLTGTVYLPSNPPVGTIVPYLGGTNDPNGWVACDGDGRNNTNGIYNNVIALGIGTSSSGGAIYTPPNLKAAFMRGTGTAPNTTFVGPALGTTQGQQIINHGHSVADHTHVIVSGTTTYFAPIITNTNTLQGSDSSAGELNLQLDYLNLSGVTTGTADVTSNATVLSGGGTETRPYNYGVHWILKL